MVKCVFRILTTVIVAASMLSLHHADAKSPATVIKPKRSDEVAGLSEFIGKLGVNGYPMVLVKSEVDHQWWVQPKPEIDARGFFRTFVTFGNEATAPETKFHVVVVVLPDESQAIALAKMGTIETIPLEVRRSVEQVYSYSPDARIDKQAGVLTNLMKGQIVSRRTEVSGNWPQGNVPMMAVRVEEPEGPWWIQSYPEVSADGKLSGVAHFGNAETVSGTNFRIAIFGLKTEKERAKFTPGNVCDKLPDDSQLLDSFVVKASGGEEAAPPVEAKKPAEQPSDSAEQFDAKSKPNADVTQAAVRLPGPN